MALWISFLVFGELAGKDDDALVYNSTFVDSLISHFNPSVLL